MTTIEQNLKICGIAIELTSSQTENFVVIQKHWKNFNDQLKKYGLTQNGGNWEKFGITFKANEKYYYFAAIPMQNQRFPDHFIRKEIPKGDYKVFTHKGKMESIKQTISEIYKVILPKSDLQVEDQAKAKFFHFEKYNYRFHWNRADSIIDIYLPVNTNY